MELPGGETWVVLKAPRAPAIPWRGPDATEPHSPCGEDGRYSCPGPLVVGKGARWGDRIELPSAGSGENIPIHRSVPAPLPLTQPGGTGASEGEPACLSAQRAPFAAKRSPSPLSLFPSVGPRYR